MKILTGIWNNRYLRNKNPAKLNTWQVTSHLRFSRFFCRWTKHLELRVPVKYANVIICSHLPYLLQFFTCCPTTPPDAECLAPNILFLVRSQSLPHYTTQKSCFPSCILSILCGFTVAMTTLPWQKYGGHPEPPLHPLHLQPYLQILPVSHLSLSSLFHPVFNLLSYERCLKYEW